MSSSLSSLADNLANELHKDKCKNCKSSLEYSIAKDNTLTFKCVDCNRDYEEFDEDLAYRFQKTHKFYDGDHNNFCLMLWKGVYEYEYMNSWQRFNETPLPDKKEFYSSLTMEDIKNADYKHAKRIWEDFKI